jgi:peptidyl-prolyl cis-trans isomerase SDCCAG10
MPGQSQQIQMNSSFDAYLMANRPTLTPKAQMLTMTRHFELDDDLKEFWGFYLLKGSEVTVYTCARYYTTLSNSEK